MSVKERGRARRLHNRMPFQLRSTCGCSQKLRRSIALVRLRHQRASTRAAKSDVRQALHGHHSNPTGGSTEGTTLAYGDWELRIRGQGVRLTAKQLTTAEEIIKA